MLPSDNSSLMVDLFKAYYEARRHKRLTESALQFEMHFEQKLFQLHDDLVSRRYHISPSTCFIVTKPVRREIFAGDFRDRIVHHLLFNYLNPFCERLFINDSYACRKGKGTSYGIARADHFIRSVSCNYTRPCYVLQLDISGYFMSINRTILYEKVELILERYKNEITFDVVLLRWLLEKVIFHDHVANCIRYGDIGDWDELPASKSLFHAMPGCGLPIGNLTSQLFGNVYLSGFDHFAGHLTPGLRYGRYVDDMLFVHEDKQALLNIVPKVQRFLAEKLALTLHPKKVHLCQYEYGVDFLGAVLLTGRKYPRRQLITNTWHMIEKWNDRVKHGEDLSEVEKKTLVSSLNAHIGHLACFQTRSMRCTVLKQCSASLLSYVRLDQARKKVTIR